MGLRFSRPISLKFRDGSRLFRALGRSLYPSFTIITAEKEPVFFLSFKIEAAALAAALREEDPGAALGPFETALDTLLDAKPMFDQVLQHLKASSA